MLVNEPQHFPVRRFNRWTNWREALTEQERPGQRGPHCLVYRFYDAAQQPLYTGMSTNGTLRWDGHRKSSPWWALTEYVAVSFYGTSQEAATAELAAIRAERPVCNRQGLAPRKQVLIKFGDGAEAIAAELHNIADPDLVRQLAQLLATPERFPGPTPPPAPVFPVRE